MQQPFNYQLSKERRSRPQDTFYLSAVALKRPYLDSPPLSDGPIKDKALLNIYVYTEV